jgi:hypothetical protein
MLLSHKLIPEHSNYWSSNNSPLESENVVLLVIINLHLDNKITDKKMFALFKQYNQKTLLNAKTTYHCNINDEWYNDESMYEVYLDCYHKLCQKRDLELDVILKYLNLLLNKNKNYCIDAYYTKFIEPLIDNLSRDIFGYKRYNVEILSNLGANFENYMTYDEFQDTWQATSGYCCSDCDGCLSQYKQYQYEQYLGYDFKQKIQTQIINYLNTFKKINKYLIK